MDLPIVSLADLSRGQVDQVVDLMVTTWPTHYGPEGQGNAVADVAARQNQDCLPYGVAALNVSGSVIGTAALAETSFGSIAGEAPWCVGLTVHPDWRKDGVATAMVASIEASAAKLGFQTIHTTTRSAKGAFVRNGWAVERDIEDATGRWTVLVKSIALSDGYFAGI